MIVNNGIGSLKKITGVISLLFCLFGAYTSLAELRKEFLDSSYYWRELDGEFGEFLADFFSRSDTYLNLWILLASLLGIYFIISTGLGFRTKSISKAMDYENAIIKMRIEKMELLKRLESLEKKISI